MGKLVHPERRMQDEHPWNIFKTLQRLAVKAKLEGRPDSYFSPSDIANSLYDNWPSLTVRQTLLVLEAKLNFSIRFLKARAYIEERMERPSLSAPAFSPMRSMDEYRIRYFPDTSLKEILGDNLEAAVRDNMDDKWGDWIGRKKHDWRKYLVDSE